MDNPNGNYGIVNVSGECFDYVKVFSDGFWNLKPEESILQHPLVRFQMQLLVMVSTACGFHILLKRFNVPRISTDILAGFILGPTFLEYYFPQAMALLFPPVPNQMMGSLLKIGFVLYIFLTIVKSDLSLIRKAGAKIVILGVVIFAFPYSMSQTIHITFDPKQQLSQGMIGVRLMNTNLIFHAFTDSEFVDVTSVLIQLKLDHSRLGHLALATSMISDLARFLYINIITLILNRVVYSTSLKIGIQTLLFMVFYMGFILLGFRKLVQWFIRSTPEGKPINDLYTLLIVGTILLLPLVEDMTGLPFLTGTAMMGLIVPRHTPLGISLISKLDTIVSGLFIPLIYIYCASRFDFWAFLTYFSSALNFQLALIGYLIKLVVTFIIILCLGVHYKEAATLALILSAPGPRVMGAFYFYCNLETMDLDSTSEIFLYFLVVSSVYPMVKKLYDPTTHFIGHHRKCIQYLPSNTTLELLICAHKKEDVLASNKLLELSNPTKDSPITIYGLCLEELILCNGPSRIIDHNFGQRKATDKGFNTQPIIDIFRQFQMEHPNFVKMNVFTSILPMNSMHKHISWLAFNNTCSMILLPFHKKWNKQGRLVMTNKHLRNLNIKVLETAPCSVGILIDRNRTYDLSTIFESSTLYRVAVLFIGGSDDREAMAYAMRMAKSSKVQLTVLHFVTMNQDSQGRNYSRDDILDNEALGGMKQEMSKNIDINYVQEAVRYGLDVVTTVQSIQGNYDLIILGRRHDTKSEAVSGLSQCVKLPELGPIGDQIASSETNNNFSILVVQQQIMSVSHNSNCALN